MAIKKSDVYSSLWACCDELRGGMDERLTKLTRAKSSRVRLPPSRAIARGADA